MLLMNIVFSILMIILFGGLAFLIIDGWLRSMDNYIDYDGLRGAFTIKIFKIFKLERFIKEGDNSGN